MELHIKAGIIVGSIILLIVIGHLIVRYFWYARLQDKYPAAVYRIDEILNQKISENIEITKEEIVKNFHKALSMYNRSEQRCIKKKHVEVIAKSIQRKTGFDLKNELEKVRWEQIGI